MKIDPSRIQFPTTVVVTEQEIDISQLSDAQKKYYCDLLEEIASIYESKNKPRVIIAIAGASGSGKSTTAAILREIARQVSLPCALVEVGIDAFHHFNEHLISHSLKEHKGRYDTYDVTKLLWMLERFAAGENVAFPLYSRKLHDPIENAIKVTEPKTLLLIEGLWLLLNTHGWRDVQNLLDYSFFIESDIEKVKKHVVARSVRGGRTKEDATEYYDQKDAKNAELIAKVKYRAHKIIAPHYEI